MYVYVCICICIYTHVYMYSRIHVYMYICDSGQTYYTPKVTTLKFHWKVPLKVHWTFPVNIHWQSDNPFETTAEQWKSIGKCR